MSTLALALTVFLTVALVISNQSILLNQESIISAGLCCQLMIVVIGMTTSLARAIGAHSEIRTLLTFKKLRDDRSVVTP